MTEFSKSGVLDRFDPLFKPRSVAVVGASQTSKNAANKFLLSLLRNGFLGNIYPIHPRAEEIEGIKTIPTVGALPEKVDYAFVAIKAPDVVAFINEARDKIRIAQIMSSGFGESAEGISLEQDLVAAAKDANIRILGPNCMGIHSPYGKLGMIDGAMECGGNIGFLSQSGGLCLDVLRRGKVLGLKFSAAVSMGNCADVGPNDLLEYMLADTRTKYIGFYLENVRDGRRFFEQLRASKATKPIVILKGGQTKQGQRAAASHTGSIVDDNRLWQALARQTGSILVSDIQELIDCLIALQCQGQSKNLARKNVILFGNGGGTSVVATDQFSLAGMDVSLLEPKLRESLEQLGMQNGVSLANPIDIPGSALMRDDGLTACRVIDIVSRQQNDAAMVVHLNLTVLEAYGQKQAIFNLIDGIVEARGVGMSGAPLHLILRSNGDRCVEELKAEARTQAMNAGIPVFDELKNSAQVLAAFNRYENFKARCLLPMRSE